MIKKLFSFLLFLTFIVWLIGYGVFVGRVLEKAPERIHDKTDAIIVLTGGNFRINTGFSLLQSGLSDTVYITGVAPQVTEDDLRALWRGKGDLPECCIILGHRARTTLGNAQETRDWIKENNIDSIRLVTSTYHMDRALLEFKNMIGHIEIIQHPVEEIDYDLKDRKFWILTFKEYNKILFRWAVMTLSKQG